MCQRCGINLAWAAQNITETCPACGTVNPAGAQKCSSCGLNLEWERQQRAQQAGVVPPVVPAPYGAPQPYGSPQPYGPAQATTVPRLPLEPSAQIPYAPAQAAAVAAGVETALAREKARQRATGALTSAIIGIFICAPVLGPIAIVQGAGAKKVLVPGEDGYGQATAAQIIGGIALGLWILGIIIAIIVNVSQ